MTIAPSTAAGYQAMFDAKNDLRWSGGDQAVTIPGPNGDAYWMFHDTMVSGVPDADGTVQTNVSLIPNSILLQRGGDLLSTTPAATAIRSDSDGAKYWPLSGFYRASDKRLIVLAYRIAGGSNPSLANTGTRVVSFSVGTTGALTLAGIYPTPATSGSAPSWGTSSYLHSDGYVYVYGSSNNPDPNEWGRRVQVARVPALSAATPSAWRYWNGSSWGTSVSATYVGTSWSTGASLHFVGGRWIVVTKEHEFPGTQVIALTSTSVTGPWTKTVLFESVSTSTESTYSAYLHPELALSNGLLVTICHNRAGAVSWQNESADLYKPEFREVLIP